MCGIAGVIKKKGIVTSEELLLMRDSFVWRGPDDADLWINDNAKVGFGHRRLSILDVSSAGRQPMHGNGNGITIVFNGEIYNYLELRERLKTSGYHFKTNTDTEVIIYAYEEWGQDCLQYFNGMFAFAIWDLHKQQLFLARDRIGIKPLYYYTDGSGSFYFASEMKAILAAIPSIPEEDHRLVDTYMSYGYVPGENTLIKKIKHLMPGHYLLIENNAKMVIKKYWEVDFSPAQDKGLDYFLEKGSSLLNSAIAYRLRSDVPLGIFLSGGIDSSTIVGLLAANNMEKLKTFSVAYDFGDKFNETPYARMVAEKFNTDHHEVIASPEKFMEFIPEYIKYMDEPVAESAAISLYFVSKLAGNHVTVVLSGEGSDELFAGYDFYVYMLMIEKYRKLIGKKRAAEVARILPDIFKFTHKINKYLALSGLPLNERYKGISTYEESTKKTLYKKEYTASLQNQSSNEMAQFAQALFSHTSNSDDLSKMLFFDLKTWLVNDLLIKADRMSMAASLELRVPFLDHRVVEFAATLPSKYKIKNMNTKYFLKQMVKDILPHQIINRKKMGFPTPLAAMFKKDLREYVYDTLTGKNVAINKYFNSLAVENILIQHTKNEKDNHKIIWQLLVLEQWLKMVYR
jgi:asparagine synthase (glutamine-hydrolysing)